MDLMYLDSPELHEPHRASKFWRIRLLEWLRRVELALPAVASRQLGVNGLEHTGLVLAPAGADKVLRRCRTADAFDHTLRRQDLQRVHHALDVLFPPDQLDVTALDLVA